jgi:hypothetical protein
MLKLSRNAIAVLLAFLAFATGVLYNCTTDSKASDPIPQLVDYNFHIRPILSDKCFKCHGPDANKREADLRLDTEEGAFAALKESPDKHAFVAGNPGLSEVYIRITTPDSSILMPPPEANLSLSAHEIKLIEKWIEQGAIYKPHWSFIAPTKAALPKADKEWVINEIDFFTFDKMKENGLSPSEMADKATLLKRVSLDLTGLPPSLEMQEEFMADNSEDAYEKVVDALLSDKHYGEKMATEWLDVARYADSHGYQDDGLRTMWPWRDWVIHAFNSNYGYDKFITWQLAGDLIPNKNKESILATGFNRNHKITQEGGVIDEEYRSEYVTDRTNTFGKAFLSMTFECSKCHDHKYDPISQKDYYSTYAFFNQVPEKGLFGTIDASFADPPNMSISDEDVASILDFVNKKDTMDVKVMVMKDSVGLRKTYLLERGNYDQNGDLVSFGLPKSIMSFDTTTYEPNRLGLSKWLLSKDNPLTARVYVNRVWNQLFGQGIVRTIGDFGMQGDLPSHPELLDWLAVDFQENNWDIKALVKKMVMSATYRQSSVVQDEHLKKDPSNIFLARSKRFRISAENVRDLALYSAGILNEEVGGPSFKPYQPDGIWESATSGRGTLAKYVQDHGEDIYRRGMYVFIKRTVPPPNMLIFDASNRDQCEVQRTRTNTPLQALVMLNDPIIVEASRVLAEKLMRSKKVDEAAIDEAFKRILCRSPSKKELAILVDFITTERARLEKEPTNAKKLLLVGEYESLYKTDKVDVAALMNTIQIIYNMEEAIVRT